MAEAAEALSHGSTLAIGVGLILGGAAAAARLVATTTAAATTMPSVGRARRGDAAGGDSDDDDASRDTFRRRPPAAKRSKSMVGFSLLRRRAGSVGGGLAMMGLGPGSGAGSGGEGGGGGSGGGEGLTSGGNPPPSSSTHHQNPLARSASAAEVGGAAPWGRQGGGGGGGDDNGGSNGGGGNGGGGGRDAASDDGDDDNTLDADEACRGYVPWEDLADDADGYYLSRAVAVDCTHPSLPTLTHHRQNRNPPGLSPLSDTSTGLVLSALAQLRQGSWRCPRHVRAVLSRPYASCNHFDTDGLLAVWSFLPRNRELALQHAATLRHAARIGDLREAFLCPDLVSALGPADGLTFIREAYTALKVATWVSAMERRLFSAPYAKRDAAEKYRWFLPRLGRVLADPEAFWSDWQRDYSAIVSGFDLLAGPDALVERWWPPALGGPDVGGGSGGRGVGGGGGGGGGPGGALGGLISGGVSLLMGGIGSLFGAVEADDDDDDGGGGGGGGDEEAGEQQQQQQHQEGGVKRGQPDAAAGASLRCSSRSRSSGGLARAPSGVAAAVGGFGSGGCAVNTTTNDHHHEPYDPLWPSPLAVVRAPEPPRYAALFSHAAGCDAVLSMYDGRRYELELKYATFVQLASRASWPRLDLRPLAAALNELEGRSGGGGEAAALALAACNGLEALALPDGALAAPVRWVADAVTDPGPLLRLERVELRGRAGDEEEQQGGEGGAANAGAPLPCSPSSPPSSSLLLRVAKLPKTQRYGDPCDRPIYSSTLPPAKLQAVVASYFECALRETGARPRGPVTAVLATEAGGEGGGGGGGGEGGYGGGASGDNTGGAGWSWEAMGALNDDLRRRIAPAWRRDLLERDAAGALDGLAAGHEEARWAAAGAGAGAFGGGGGASAVGGAAAAAVAAATTSGWHYDTERSGRRRNPLIVQQQQQQQQPQPAAAPPAAAAGPLRVSSSSDPPTTPRAAHQQLLAAEQQHAIPLVAPPAAYGDPPPALSEPSPILLAAAAAAAGGGGGGGNGGGATTTAPLRALAAALPPLQRRRPWTLLYSTARDGTSLSTLLRKAAGRSPTVLLVRDGQGCCFGAYCTEPWRPCSRFFGTGESWVFRLAPGPPTRYPWVGPEPAAGARGGGFSAAAAGAAPGPGSSDEAGGGGGHGDDADRHRRAAALPRTDFFQYATPGGLGVGGGGHFAIFLDEELLRGSSSRCLTYASPCLASAEEFGVRDVELWFVGGLGAEGARVGAVQAAMQGTGVGGGIAPMGRWTAH